MHAHVVDEAWVALEGKVVRLGVLLGGERDAYLSSETAGRVTDKDPVSVWGGVVNKEAIRGSG